MSTLTNGNKTKIKEMLGKGLTPSTVAMAVGVTEGYISQMLANTEFATEVANMRMVELQKHNARDATYDSLEDQLLEKLQDVLVYMTKPGEVLKALQIINGAKRRGTDTLTSQGSITNSTVINLIMPKHTVASFSTNAIGQVVEAEHETSDGTKHTQSLVTLQSRAVKDLLAKGKANESKDKQTIGNAG